MRKICVVTGSRAEYGLLSGLMQEIKDDPNLKLQLIVTGTHLSSEFGLTYKTIESEGFLIDEKIEMLLSSDTPVGITKSLGIAIIGFADALQRLNPDILLLLGDRYEIFAAAQAGLLFKIPIAHIHGGETTEGAMDESIRHSITKMAHFHFVAADVYGKRVVQLGENSDYVFNFGALGLENIQNINFLSREEFENNIGFQLGKINFLVTYHPVTLNAVSAEVPMGEILKALDMFPEARIIFTMPNADIQGKVIKKLIEKYVLQNPKRAIHFNTLGQALYLNAVHHVDAVLGNSSSGLIEVPALKKPTVNIGDRQKGRLESVSVITCREDQESIVLAIRKALSSDFQKKLLKNVSLYDRANTVKRIKEYLKTASLDGILTKKFYDLNGPMKEEL